MSTGEKSGIIINIMHHPQSLYGYWLSAKVTIAAASTLLMLLLLFFTNGVAALSLSSSLSSSCKIVGTPGGTTQYLPTSYIQTFGRWMVVNHQLTPLLPPSTVSAVPSPAAATAVVVAVQAKLDILVKSGTPTYVMAGLQVQQQHLQHSTSRPVYSIPPWTAHQWVTFGSVVEPDFRVILFQGHNEIDDEPKILAVASTDDIRVALEDLGLALQEQSLEQGFHIVSLPLKMTKTSRDVVMDNSQSIDDYENRSNPADDDADSTSTCTDDSNSKKLDWIPLNHDITATSILTCLATAEVNARELLSLDPTLLEMTVTSILQVPLSQVQQHAT
jgi:hypothetical protein